MESIKVIVCEGLERSYLEKIIKESPLKYDFKIDLYVLGDIKSCRDIAKKIGKKDRKSFIKAFKSGVHFSYSSGNKHIIVIFAKNDKEIIKNKNAFIGLLIHEIEHI